MLTIVLIAAMQPGARVSFDDIRQHIVRKRATSEARPFRPPKKSPVAVSAQAPAAASMQAPAAASMPSQATASTQARAATSMQA